FASEPTISSASRSLLAQEPLRDPVVDFKHSRTEQPFLLSIPGPRAQDSDSSDRRTTFLGFPQQAWSACVSLQVSRCRPWVMEQQLLRSTRGVRTKAWAFIEAESISSVFRQVE